MSKTTYKNVDAIPTWKIEEILASPNCTGIDGADYEPVKAELQTELWKRYVKEAKDAEHQLNQDQKALFKFEASKHKKTK